MGWRKRLRRGHGDLPNRAEPHIPVPESAYRRDVQGLRAVAVLLVVLDHAGLTVLSGGYVGVDVFFVLSGFLITGLLLAGVKKRGYVSFTDFYIRRAKRILPAATLTLVATILASYLLLNVVRARQAIVDSLWAAFFGANVQFAREGTDYFAQGQPPSPVQHYWSLSVEEQFYFAWPALIAIVLFGAAIGAQAGRRRRRHGYAYGRSASTRLLAVTLVVLAASLTWSIVQTGDEPTSAYFSTLTRAWELALGAVLAIAGQRLTRVPQTVQSLMCWVGLAMVVTAAVTFSTATSFPGYAALLPTLGTALVIAGGTRSGPDTGSAGRLLAAAPMRYVGDRSYALYLWHWPVLVIAAQYAGRELSLATNLALVAAAFGLSIASYALVEQPIRRADWTPSASWTLVPASAAAVAVISLVSLNAIDAKVLQLANASASTEREISRTPQPAERAVTGGGLASIVAAVKAARRGAAIPVGLTPPADRLLDREYLYEFPDGCAASDDQTQSAICRLGAPSSRRSMIVFGDSHAQMWMPTVLATAERDGWAVIPLVKSGCVPSAWRGRGYDDMSQAALRDCHRWYAWASGQAKTLRADVVLVSGCCAGALGRVEKQTIDAYTHLAATVKRAATQVVVLGDAEGVDRQPVDCLLGRRSTMRTCTTIHSNEHFALNDDLAAVAGRRGFRFLDTRGWFCHGHECPMVVGQTVVYRDTGHITVPYALALVEPFRAAFRRCVAKRCPS